MGIRRMLALLFFCLGPTNPRASLLCLLWHLAAGKGCIRILLAVPLCIGGDRGVRLIAQPPPLLAPRALQQGTKS